jgi:hypothetical protein
MAPRAPNYAQDRLQRERAQAAKHAEKAERRAEESAKRKALKDAEPGTPEDSKPD